MRRAASRGFGALALFFTAIALAAAGGASAARLQISETQPYVPGQIVVALRAGDEAPGLKGGISDATLVKL